MPPHVPPLAYRFGSEGHLFSARRLGQDVELLRDGRTSALENVARDEELLARGRPVVRVAILADRAVSIGIAQREDGRTVRGALAAGVAWLRRASGGTGVLHLPGDLAWSVVLPRTDPRAGRDFVRAYGRFGAGVVGCLGDLGVDAAWVPAPGLSEEMCLLGDRGEVLAAGPRVLGGAAQHLTRRAILHHGVISVELDRELEATIFGVPLSTLATRRAGLRELGVHPASEWLAARLLAGLGRGLVAVGSAPGTDAGPDSLHPG